MIEAVWAIFAIISGLCVGAVIATLITQAQGRKLDSQALNARIAELETRSVKLNEILKIHNDSFINVSMSLANLNHSVQRKVDKSELEVFVSDCFKQKLN